MFTGLNEIDYIKCLAQNAKPELEHMSANCNPLPTLDNTKKFTVVKDTWLCQNNFTLFSNK